MAANNLLCLDVGEKRVGVARASAQARLAEPYTTLINDATIYTQISGLVSDLQVNRLVVGLPRNMNNEDTAQTGYVRRFVEELRNQLRTINIEFQDEADSSRRAEAELIARKKAYEKGDVDMLAATYILQDFLSEHPGGAI